MGRRDECRARARGWGLPLSGTGPDSFLSRKLRPWERGKVCLELQFGQWTFALYLGGHPKFQDRIFVRLWTSGNLLSPRVPVRPTLGAPAALPRA